MSILRTALAVSLSLAIALTSGAMAVARGHAGEAVGVVVLCIGHRTVAVHVDAAGDPIEAPHFCPDCVLGFAALHASPLALFHAALLISASRPIPSVAHPTVQSAAAWNSRAPPV